MGLDMYLAARVDGEEKLLGYWRKHPNLHGFIVKKFALGVDECQMIPLTVTGLKAILKASEEDALPETQGFFFGTSMPEDKVETKAILTEAIAWLKAHPGAKVWYQASW